MATEQMTETVKAYQKALVNLRRAKLKNAGAEDLRPVNAAKGDVDRAEEAMVLRMIAEISAADRTKGAEILNAFNRARSSAVYWPRMVDSALRYADI